MNPYAVVKQFEQAVAEYCGSKYAVATTSCTAALLLACAWHKDRFKRLKTGNPIIILPSKTYVSVPQSVIHAGFQVAFQEKECLGSYQLDPLAVYDCARRFTSGMYVKNTFQCLSFHWTKILSIGQGGCVLHDNDEADEWLRRARFDGRKEGVSPKDDTFSMIGWHCYMSPRDAAEGLSRLAVLPKHNADLPNSDYPDLSLMSIFK